MTEQNERHFDLVIMGGGLAGLTLALQVRQRLPAYRILVLERRAHPVPLAAHKVGESSVELAAHYFANVLGLKDHLQKDQLKKFGFRFFFSEGAQQLDQVTELGASTFLMSPSYQIDRGVFENYLGTLARERGITFVDEAVVKTFELPARGTQEAHRLEYQHAGVRQEVSARWLVDAAGRAGLIKRKLDLAEPSPHDVNSVWFRVKGFMDVNAWSQDSEWLARCNPPNRWLSTNHLCGEGYWVWMIPLASGAHSIGIVCDAKLHPLDKMNTYERAMQWFAEHQPSLHAALQGRELLDFAFFRRFSYSAKRMYSGDQRWCLTGEAGVFLDPFYSPGSDFIAISNTFITELIERDAGGEPVAQYARIYERIFFQFYESMLPLYLDQYKLFGDATVMPVKVIWDYTYYWGVMCLLFYQNKMIDLRTMSTWQPALDRLIRINAALQTAMRHWGAARTEQGLVDSPAQMLDQSKLPWFAELNKGLMDTLDAAGFTQRMNQNLAQLDALAQEIVARMQLQCPQLDLTEISALLATLPARTEQSPSMLFPSLEGVMDASTV
jgi:flavin-dependent dehydrogenase